MYAPASLGAGQVEELVVVSLGGAGDGTAILLDPRTVRGPGIAPSDLAVLRERSPDFVAVADLDGRLRYLNAAGAALVGLGSPGAAVGRSRRRGGTPRSGCSSRRRRFRN